MSRSERQADLSARSHAGFVAGIRAYLGEHLPPDMAARGRRDVHPSREDMLGITAILSRAGWSVPHWPEAHGGPGWSGMQRYLFEEELMLAGAPPNNIQGVSLVGPVIYTFGTQAQQARYLAPIREGREFWAQGFSEPGSGSDLASLRTRAVREGEGEGAVYVVNGQKIWTSQAFMADMLFCLVRTDTQAKAQLGISFLLIPMRSPGVRVRPIQSIDEGESLCEVFLDDVRVPVQNLVGEEGRGWDYAKFLLGNERVTTADVPRNKRYLAALKAMAKNAPSPSRHGVRLYDEPVFRQRMARLEIDLIALESAAVGTIELDDHSPLTPSALKIHGTELIQGLLELQVESLGAHGAAFFPHESVGEAGERWLRGLGDAPDAPGVLAEYLFRRAATIYGGSTEIQKNIIAKLLFGGRQAIASPVSEDQAQMQQSAERFAAQWRETPWRDFEKGDASLARRRWLQLADTGFLGLGIDEAVGGQGGSLDDLAVVMAALGRGGVAEPLGSCCVSVAHLLATAEWPSERRREALERLVSGAQVFAFAHLEAEDGGAPGARSVATRAAAMRDGFVLDGAKCAVMGGAMADFFIVPARSITGAADAAAPVALFLVPAGVPGLKARHYRSVDGQVVADLSFERVELASDALIASGDAAALHIDEAILRAIVMACAQAVGTMETLFGSTLDYLQTRRQFGAPLASFQALQHRMAEMYGELALSRAMLRRAVAALESREPAMPSRERIVSAAKSRIGRAAFFVRSQSVQLHGGIGMTQECEIGRLFKRLHAFEVEWGNAHHHAARFADTNDD
ncbi:acyl-CoA dehydrogenase family protein [Variovorax sp. PBL-E5]|uniref:acyl-CoA dehydrogenase family protein n=1 Tax=Variovorax sp. PBL-E5 TaxID=434014 RepID=UPI0013193837|nr:Acyl-CoA dehydrogenase, short-chain specific [Variovorax sp. PBL-E5]